MRRLSVSGTLLAVVLVAGLTGCMALHTPEEQPVYWELQPTGSRAGDGPANQPASGGLLVARVQAEAHIDTTAMLYREVDFEPRYYARNRWVDRPTRQIQTAIVNTLVEQQAVDNVLRGPSQLPARYRLETELVALEHDYRGDQPEAVIVVRVLLIDQRDRVVLGTRVLTAREPMSRRHPEAGVAAHNQALGDVVQRIRAMIAELVPPDA